MEFAVGMAMQEEVFYSPREGGGEHAVALEAIREAGGAYVVFSPREGSQLEVVLATLPAVLDAFGNRIVPVPATSSGGERGGVTSSEGEGTEATELASAWATETAETVLASDVVAEEAQKNEPFFDGMDSDSVVTTDDSAEEARKNEPF